jgi:hypothetical protein
MNKIQWHKLPLAVENHLLERAIERQISLDDLKRLDRWKQSDPEAPDGEWCKDFGSFKLCGEGALPKTFLMRGQAARGKRIG